MKMLRRYLVGTPMLFLVLINFAISQPCDGMEFSVTNKTPTNVQLTKLNISNASTVSKSPIDILPYNSKVIKIKQNNNDGHIINIYFELQGKRIVESPLQVEFSLDSSDFNSCGYKHEFNTPSSEYLLVGSKTFFGGINYTLASK